MRLLSFITDIERALLASKAAVDGGEWEVQRMVNFQHRLARLTLKARPGVETSVAGGVIFVQAYVLADGSLCLKASLNWTGSIELPVIAIYATPALNWKIEAKRIAAGWLQGPPANGTISTTELGASEVQAIAS